MQHMAPRHPVPLSSRLAAGELAWRSVCAVGAALSPDDIALPDPDRIAAAYRSDRHLLVDGEAPDVWSPLSRFWRTGDGWVRTHGNYPHHASALRAGLGLPPDASPDDVSTRLAAMSAGEAREDITGAGGLSWSCTARIRKVTRCFESIRSCRRVGWRTPPCVHCRRTR